jgi:hypothetical protein
MVLTPQDVFWPTATRIIASRYPPIDLFERISGDPKDWEAYIELESLVNPRLRQEVGDISLVPIEDRISGNGASYVMASFTHLNPKGSRFSDGSYGVYYAGRDFETALRETVHHYELFYADADLGITRSEPMRVLVGMVNAEFLNVTSLPAVELQQVLHPSNYAAGQRLAVSIRDSGANGLIYPSVRHPSGECIAAFKPKAVGIPIQAKHLEYHWNGTRIDKYFDYEMNMWINI